MNSMMPAYVNLSVPTEPWLQPDLGITSTPRGHHANYVWVRTRRSLHICSNPPRDHRSKVAIYFILEQDSTEKTSANFTYSVVSLSHSKLAFYDFSFKLSLRALNIEQMSKGKVFVELWGRDKSLTFYQVAYIQEYK